MRQWRKSLTTCSLHRPLVHKGCRLQWEMLCLKNDLEWLKESLRRRFGVRKGLQPGSQLLRVQAVPEAATSVLASDSSKRWISVHAVLGGNCLEEIFRLISSSIFEFLHIYINFFHLQYQQRAGVLRADGWNSRSLSPKSLPAGHEIIRYNVIGLGRQ